MVATTFALIKSVRKHFASIIEQYPLDLLNQIPEGFNNNLVWHLGHIVVTTEVLCYHRAGLDAGLDIPFLEKYKIGTRPEAWVAQEEIDLLLKRLLQSIDLLEEQYLAGMFSEIKPVITKTFNVDILQFEDLIQNCALHDSLHWGNIIAMQKLLK